MLGKLKHALIKSIAIFLIKKTMLLLFKLCSLLKTWWVALSRNTFCDNATAAAIDIRLMEEVDFPANCDKNRKTQLTRPSCTRCRAAEWSRCWAEIAFGLQISNWICQFIRQILWSYFITAPALPELLIQSARRLQLGLAFPGLILFSTHLALKRKKVSFLRLVLLVLMHF